MYTEEEEEVKLWYQLPFNTLYHNDIAFETQHGVLYAKRYSTSVKRCNIVRYVSPPPNQNGLFSQNLIQLATWKVTGM